MDFRILAVHRLLDIVKTLNGADADRLWGKIGGILQTDFTVEQIPLMVLKRFINVPFTGMQGWARHHFCWRRKARMEAQQLPLAYVGTVHAVAKDIDTDGGLIVQRDGRLERVVAGEVLWNRRP